LRVRTGLWLVPSHLVGHEADAVASLASSVTDVRHPLLDGLLPDQTRLGLRPVTILQALDTLVAEHVRGDWGLVLNLDLLLAGLTSTDRQQTWEALYSAYPRRQRALLFAVPAAATHLLPKHDGLDQWRREGRLAD
jgi:hypothetical protein